MPNKYVLTGDHIEVTYTPGITPGLTAFTYKDRANTKDFPGAQVQVSQSPIGELVTVTLVEFLGAPGETFSVLLPVLTGTAPIRFKTLGIHTRLRGPAIEKGFVPSYTVTHLTGVAEDAIIPL